MAPKELEPREKKEVENESQTHAARYFVPDTDIYEDSEALWLWADMPGVDQQNVSVDLEEGVLTLQGSVSLEDYKGLRPAYTEYNVGHFSRRFTLPGSSHFDREGITARLADGVLEIKLPKAEKAKPRRIPVES